MNFFYYASSIVVLLFFWAPPIWSETVPGVTASATLDGQCEQFNSVKNIVDCAMQRHPMVLESQISLEQGTSLERTAGQLPNPELNTVGLWGPSPTTGGYSLEVNLAQTIELGGKRGARIDKATATKDHLNSSFLSTQEQVYHDTILALFRLRQIHIELKDLDEALSLFREVEKQYRARFRLSPEQQATLYLIEIAEGEYLLKRSPLLDEIDHLEKFMTMALGKRFEVSPDLLPKEKTAWPVLERSKEDSTLKSAKVLAAKAQRNISLSQLELSKGEAWPDLKIGPSIQIQRQVLQDFHVYGLNLTFTLPVLNQNGGAKAHSAQEVDKSEVNYTKTKKEADHEYGHFLEIYDRAIKDLKKSIAPHEIDKKQAQLEEMFKRGLITGSMIIETHRQLIETTKSKNARELEALDAFMRVRALEGRLLGEKYVLLD